MAIAGSLFVVGTIAAFGSLQYLRLRLIDYRSVVVFGIPGMVGTYLGAWSAVYVSGLMQLTLFALVMLTASWLMLRPVNLAQETREERATWKIATDGIVVGVITGLVGVGGGFLIVPALVLLGGLTMHRAVGTSLVIIALKSFSGFFKYLDVLARESLQLDWQILAIVAALGIGGTVAGGRIANRMPQAALKKGFAYFLILMGIYILARSLPGVIDSAV